MCLCLHAFIIYLFIHTRWSRGEEILSGREKFVEREERRGITTLYICTISLSDEHEYLKLGQNALNPSLTLHSLHIHWTSKMEMNENKKESLHNWRGKIALICSLLLALRVFSLHWINYAWREASRARRREENDEKLNHKISQSIMQEANELRRDDLN